MSNMKAIATLLVASLVPGLAATSAQSALPGCQLTTAEISDRKTHRISLKRLEAELEHCQARQDCSATSLRWYGITRVEGFVVDPTNRDILIVGTAQPGAPELHVEDFVVALRNVLQLYTAKVDGGTVVSDPAVSIDPHPKVLLHLEHIMDVVAKHEESAAWDFAEEAW